jgi:hypothetical protein
VGEELRRQDRAHAGHALHHLDEWVTVQGFGDLGVGGVDAGVDVLQVEGELAQDRGVGRLSRGTDRLPPCGGDHGGGELPAVVDLELAHRGSQSRSAHPDCAASSASPPSPCGCHV